MLTGKGKREIFHLNRKEGNSEQVRSKIVKRGKIFERSQKIVGAHKIILVTHRSISTFECLHFTRRQSKRNKNKIHSNQTVNRQLKFN